MSQVQTRSEKTTQQKQKRKKTYSRFAHNDTLFYNVSVIENLPKGPEPSMRSPINPYEHKSIVLFYYFYKKVLFYHIYED